VAGSITNRHLFTVGGVFCPRDHVFNDHYEETRPRIFFPSSLCTGFCFFLHVGTFGTSRFSAFGFSAFESFPPFLITPSFSPPLPLVPIGLISLFPPSPPSGCYCSSLFFCFTVSPSHGLSLQCPIFFLQAGGRRLWPTLSRVRTFPFP